MTSLTIDPIKIGARRSHAQVLAGFLFVLVGVGMTLSIITGEALYPRRYSTFANTISDLSGTEPPHSVMVEPSRTLFIVTMLVAGVLVLVATWALARCIHRRRVIAAFGVFGVGLIGIGVFPGNVEGWHPLFAMVCFIAGITAVVMSRKVIVGPLRHVALVLGLVALLALVFGIESLEDWGPQAELGRGGIERWIAYPVLMWLVAFGSHLLTGAHEKQ